LAIISSRPVAPRREEELEGEERGTHFEGVRARGDEEFGEERGKGELR